MVSLTTSRTSDFPFYPKKRGSVSFIEEQEDKWKRFDFFPPGERIQEEELPSLGIYSFRRPIITEEPQPMDLLED